MKILPILVTVFFLSTTLYPQDQAKVDSLLHVLDTEISKKERVDTYVELARAYNNIDTLKVIDFAEKAWAISEEISYTHGMADVWNIKGYIAVEITDLDRATQLFEKGYDLAEKVNYMRGMSISLSGIGIVKWKIGQYDESLQVLNESLDKLSKSDGPKDFVPIYNNIALVHYLKGDYDKAIENFQECIKIYEASGNESGLGRLLMNTGVMYVSKGENRESLVYYKRALEIQKKFGQKNNMAGTLNNTGVAYKNMGNLDSALIYYSRSMKLNLEQGLKTGVAQLYNNIGAIHGDRGVYDSSEYYYKKAILLYEELSDFYNASMTYRNVGHNFFNMGNYPKALEYYLIALKMAREIEAKSIEGEFLNAIGKIYLEQGESDKALTHYRQSIEISTSIDNKMSTSETYSSIGILYESKGVYDSAIYYHESSLKLNEEMGHEFGISQNYLDLAACYEKKGLHPLALIYIDKSLAISQALGLQVKEATGLLQKGEILIKQNKLQSALGIVKQGVSLTKETRNLTNERYGTSLMVRIYEALGNFEEAFKNQVILGQLSDSIFNEANTKELTLLEAQYEFEKEKIINEKAFENELSIQQTKQQKQFTILLIAIASGLIITVLLLILYRRYILIQNKNKIIEEQKNQVELQSQKLKALDISKSNFFANISHDLRSPLTLILGSMDQVLDEEKQLSSSGKEMLESGYRNGKKLLFMTDEIRDLSRLQEGKLQLKLQLVKIVPYINLLVKMFSSAAYFKKIILKFESHIDDGKIVKIDPHQFEKIIYNLLSNAVKHTPEYGEITVQIKDIETDSKKLIIDIVDTGVGIPPDQINHVFDRYYQVPSQVLGENVGFGIGLALCKEIADLHHATISAKSNQNEGSTFSICLDYSAEKPEDGFVVDEYYEPIYSPIMETSPDEEESDTFTTKREKTVLIVEDHREIRRYMDNLLNNEYHTLQAKNGEEALTILKTEKVDIIISDLMMPYIDGFELLKQLKAEENYAHIPVLIVSARTNEEDKLEILKLGAEEIVAKPFTPSEIKLRLQNLLTKTSDNSVLKLFEPSNVKSGVEHIISEKVKQVILERIDDPNLLVIDFCEVLAASERKVFRLIKKIFNLTPLELIKETRWQYLDTLLKNGTKMSASEAGRSIGIMNVTNFKKQFEDRFGKSYTE